MWRSYRCIACLPACRKISLLFDSLRSCTSMRMTERFQRSIIVCKWEVTPMQFTCILYNIKPKLNIDNITLLTTKYHHIQYSNTFSITLMFALCMLKIEKLLVLLSPNQVFNHFKNVNYINSERCLATIFPSVPENFPFLIMQVIWNKFHMMEILLDTFLSSLPLLTAATTTVFGS